MTHYEAKHKSLRFHRPDCLTLASQLSPSLQRQPLHSHRCLHLKSRRTVQFHPKLFLLEYQKLYSSQPLVTCLSHANRSSYKHTSVSTKTTPEPIHGVTRHAWPRLHGYSWDPQPSASPKHLKLFQTPSQVRFHLTREVLPSGLLPLKSWSTNRFASCLLAQRAATAQP